MRWAKHLMLAHSDPQIAAMLEEFGAEAYGVYWLMIEDIGAPMEPGKFRPAAVHSVVKWSQISHCSVRRWRSIAGSLAKKSLINLRSIEDRIEIEVPNILKYKDEYSKKSRQTHDQEQIQIESRYRADKVEDESSIETCPPDDGHENDPLAFSLQPVSVKPIAVDRVGLWFATEFWPLYPRKVAKKRALAAARKALPGHKPSLVIAGLRAQLPGLQYLIDGGEIKSVPHPATWLNDQRWTDEVPPVSVTVTPIRQAGIIAVPDRIQRRREANILTKMLGEV